MRIVLVGYHDLHASVPRAHRVRELARELARHGHHVLVLCASAGVAAGKQSVDGYDMVTYGGHVLPPEAGRKERRGGVLSRLAPRRIRPRLKALYLYFAGEVEARFIKPIAGAVAKLGEVDMLISVGLPFSVHRGTARALKAGLSVGVSIADCGDPYFENPNTCLAPHHRAIERATLSQFDYVTIPTEIARKAYENAGVRPESIRIIPQGFALDSVRTAEHQPGSVIRFAYAGNLYPRIRNPARILDYLVRQPVPFEFHFYTDMRSSDNRSCLEPYLRALADKVVIHEPLSREGCIRELGAYDILVNLRNASENQLPSKVIDYAMVGRPILDISCANPDLGLLDSFLAGDFARAMEVDLSKHDIRRVAEQFLSLSGSRG